MSFLSNLIKKAAPIVATVAPGTPIGTAAAVVSYEQARANASYQRKLQEQQIKQEQEKMAEIFGTSSGLSSVQAPIVRPTTASAGFGAGFGEFLTDVGRNIVNPFANLFTSVAPFFGRSVVQQPAVTTTRGAGAQETQGSGTVQQAGFGAALPAVVQGARNLFGTPMGQLALGGGAAIAGSLIGADGKTMRITRKMKSQARTVLNMVGGDLSAASQILGISEQMLVQVLLKRFRNDGPVVTKAALRKTKQTVRRLKSMCDMYDSLRPRAAARRAPTRRSSTTTLIKN